MVPESAPRAGRCARSRGRRAGEALHPGPGRAPADLARVRDARQLPAALPGWGAPSLSRRDVRTRLQTQRPPEKRNSQQVKATHGVGMRRAFFSAPVASGHCVSRSRVLRGHVTSEWHCLGARCFEHLSHLDTPGGLERAGCCSEHHAGAPGACLPAPHVFSGDPVSGNCTRLWDSHQSDTI